MTFDQLLQRWQHSGEAERANKDSFLNELCDALGVERPRPKTNDAAADTYVFEKDVPRAKAGGVSIGRIDLYKRGCFLLEAKQGAASGPRRRDSPAWNQMMSDAHGQALGYATHLDEPPPFLIVCDVGYCLDLYASFDGSGVYRPFPDGLRKRIFLADLPGAGGRHAETLRAIWDDPLSLDPSRRAAKVTRDVAEQIAALARDLEAGGTDPETVATFLMRCLFTMFAEDVGLLPDRIFSRALQEWWLQSPESFPSGVSSLWRAMDQGGDFVTGRLLRFNGGLFSTHDAPRLTREQLLLLALAGKSDWSQVDPSIFGTLLERALDPRERHRLGAHYTPRAYVERLVKPTIEEPLRADWDLVRAEVRQLVEPKEEQTRAEADKCLQEAQKRVLDFHHQLCKTRVLDPACGTGNFLYVTLDLFKRLETEVLALLSALGYKQIALEMESFRVTPEQFLGIEVKRWAKEIAELVLWIGYLQWQVRQPGGAMTVPEPVLRDYGNIEHRDAVLAWDKVELVRDEKGVPVSRWDGETMRVSPVTGEEIPDDTARVPVERYVNPRRAEWPQAEFIVGNPPYIGNKRMRLALGDGYVEALRKAHDDVPETADYVMYWWNQAAKAVERGQSKQFGLITTNSITQGFSRRVVEEHMGKGGIAITFAVPDHPWVDTTDGAAVRVAMTVGAANSTKTVGTLLTANAEAPGVDGEAIVHFSHVIGPINPDLSIGTDVHVAIALQANESLCYQGAILVGEGFRLKAEDLANLQIREGSLPRVIKPFASGRDLTQITRRQFVIDFHGLSEEEARAQYPSLYQWVYDRVRPSRLQNRDEQRRRRWWLFGRSNTAMRAGLSGLSRFIATVETSKHKPFVFLPGRVLPDHKLYVLGLDDAWVLGVLSSRAHLAWALAAGGTLEDRPTWTNGSCFLPFPFPNASDGARSRIRALGESLDAHRKRQQALHPTLTLTGMYNVLEKLRSGEPLTPKERTIHEQGLVSVLKQIHDDLDAAVFDAYGWPATLTDEEILERLVALNHERAEEERRGLVRWLRPDFQNPSGARAAAQGSLAEAGLAPAAAAATKGKAAKAAAKPAWPKKLHERMAALRDALAAAGELSAAEAAAAFKRAGGDDVTAVLESLAAVGVAVEVTTPQSPERRWRAAR